MKLSDLEIFCTVAEEESFGNAAARLHFSQPAVSQHIKKMETELGFPLFIRNQHSVSLSARGTLFLEASRDILARYSQALADCQREGEKAPVLTVFYVGSSSFPFFHTLLKAYRAVHPHCEILTRRIQPDMIFSLMKSGDARLLFTPSDFLSGLRRAQFQPLYEDRLFCVMNQANPLAQKQELTCGDLKGTDILAPFKTHCPESIQPVFEKLRGTCRLLNGYNIDNVLVQLLSHADHLAVMPGHTIPENAQLCAVPLAGELTMKVGFAYTEPLTPPEKEFLSLAVRAAREDMEGIKNSQVKA